MFLEDVFVLQRYWETSPPIRTIVAAVASMMGWRPPSPPEEPGTVPFLPDEWEE